MDWNLDACQFVREVCLLTALLVSCSSVDVVISNCVINLAPSKAPVLAEIARILRTGGEFYFSDIYADRRIPEHLTKDKVCLGPFMLFVRGLGCLRADMMLRHYWSLQQRVVAVAYHVQPHFMIGHVDTCPSCGRSCLASA